MLRVGIVVGVNQIAQEEGLPAGIDPEIEENMDDQANKLW